VLPQNCKSLHPAVPPAKRRHKRVRQSHVWGRGSFAQEVLLGSFSLHWALGIGAEAGFTAALVAVYVLARPKEPLLVQQ